MKTGLIVKSASLLLFIIFLFNSASAQSSKIQQKEKNQDANTIEPVKSKSENQTILKGVDIGNESEITDNSELQIEHKKALQNNTTSRNCITKEIKEPYSISRTDFNKLPPDRKQFLLQNSNKYSIQD